MSRILSVALLSMALTFLSGCSRTPEGGGGSDVPTPAPSEGTNIGPAEIAETAAADSGDAMPAAREQAAEPPEAESAMAITPPKLVGEGDAASGAGGRPAARGSGAPAGSGGPVALDLKEGEVSLGQARVGRMNVDLAQRPGRIAGGQEAHLVVRLPDPDGGKTIVRAWLGTMNRERWEVATAEYVPADDRYDLRVTASNPVPSGAMWWIEIETPDGRKAIGAAEPVRE